MSPTWVVLRNSFTEYDEVYSFAKSERNVNHRGYDRRSIPVVGLPGNQPFVDYQEIHIAKQHDHEYELRNKLEKEV